MAHEVGADVEHATRCKALQHEDFQPRVCTLQTNSGNYSSEVKIGFLKFIEISSFVISESSDGTVSVTVTDCGGLGLERGVGAKDGGKGADGLRLGVDVTFGAALSYSVRDAREFESMNEWKALESQHEGYLFDQMMLK